MAGAFTRSKSWLALIGLGMVWGGTIPLSKIAVSSGHHPIGVIFWQFFIASIVLGPIALFFRMKISLDRTTLVFFTIICLTGTLIPNGFSFLAAPHLPAGILGIIIATVPMFALVIALLVRLENLSVTRLIGVFLGTLAVVLLVAPEASLPKPEQAAFVLLALIAPFFYGVETNYLALKTPKSAEPVTTLLAASLIGVCISAPLALVMDGWVDLSNEWQQAEWAMIGSSLLHVIAYTGYIWLVGFAGSVFASQIAYIVTMAAVMFGVVFMGESHTGMVWLALAIMIVGLALVKPRSETPKP